MPSENKADKRSIETIQADLQAKKRMKLTQASTSSTTIEEKSNNTQNDIG